MLEYIFEEIGRDSSFVLSFDLRIDFLVITPCVWVPSVEIHGSADSVPSEAMKGPMCVPIV